MSFLCVFEMNEKLLHIRSVVKQNYTFGTRTTYASTFESLFVVWIRASREDP